MTTIINGLPWCGECVYSREHVNDPSSHCYSCKRRDKFIKAVEENSTEPDFDNIPIEKIDQYLQDHGYDPKQVGLRGKILVDAMIENMKMREIIQMFLNDPGGCPFCDYGVLRKPNIPEKDHDDDCPYKIARAFLDAKVSTAIKMDFSDAEIEELGAQRAEAIELGGDNSCPSCDGSGEVAGNYFSEDGITTCDRCNGKGTL